MLLTEEMRKTLEEMPMAHGAQAARVIDAGEVVLDRSFRDMCAANYCGVYGKCWMCPPDVGEIEDLMAQLRAYKHALVFQTVTPLEDSFDVEGMAEARKGITHVSRKVREGWSAAMPETDALHLSVGGCGICAECAKRTGEPCRAPELAISSLEAYGVHVSHLAEAAGMKYINGVNTVTYFGAVFFGK